MGYGLATLSLRIVHVPNSFIIDFVLPTKYSLNMVTHFAPVGKGVTAILLDVLSTQLKDLGPCIFDQKDFFPARLDKDIVVNNSQ